MKDVDSRVVDALRARIAELETEISYCPMCEDGQAEARRLEIEAKDARIAELERALAEMEAQKEVCP